MTSTIELRVKLKNAWYWVLDVLKVRKHKVCQSDSDPRYMALYWEPVYTGLPNIRHPEHEDDDNDDYCVHCYCELGACDCEFCREAEEEQE